MTTGKTMALTRRTFVDKVMSLEKGTTEDEMVGWHHRLDGHGFGWTP